jgi:hypothetical protein
MSALAIAAAFGISVSCVCGALAHEHLMTSGQAARRRRKLCYPGPYAD